MESAYQPGLQLALIAIQVLWGLFLIVLSFAVRKVLKDLEDNTAKTARVADSLNALNLALVGNFVNKEDWSYIRTRVHELGDAVQAVRAREELRDRLHASRPRRGSAA